MAQMVLEEVDSAELGRRLEVVRTYLGLTLDDVAGRVARLTRLTRVRISRSALSSYENGNEPPIKKLRVVCRALDGADMGAFLTSDPDWFTRVWSNPELLVPAA